MEISENIDLNYPEKYILSIGINSKQFSFSLYNQEEACYEFYYQIPEMKSEDTLFLGLKEIIFENEFLLLPFRKVYIINYSSFTYVPEILFKEKDKKNYMDFLFNKKQGKILSHTVENLNLRIIHSMHEDIYNFLHRSFVNGQIIHYTSPVIEFLHLNKSHSFQTRCMVVNKQPGGIDIFCFAENRLLLANYFQCPSPDDAVYYILFIWKQLKFDQLRDFLYITNHATSLLGVLEKYIRYVAPLDIPKEYFLKKENMYNIPFEIASLALSE